MCVFCVCWCEDHIRNREILSPEQIPNILHLHTGWQRSPPGRAPTLASVQRRVGCCHWPVGLELPLASLAALLRPLLLLAITRKARLPIAREARLEHKMATEMLGPRGVGAGGGISRAFNH